MPPSDGGDRATFARYDVDTITFADQSRQGASRNAPVETPVNIVYAPVPFAVMMATPQDLEDFALGFSFTEGIIETIDDIRGIAVEEDERGLKLIVSLSSEKLQRHLARSRGGTGGIDDRNPTAPAPNGAFVVRPQAIRRALDDLSKAQALNAITGATHAAAWCGLDGSILSIREDVGRHNALDKLVGHLLRGKVDPLSGFLIITSRCSFEMVAKAAAFGIRAVVAVSAPTSLAIERARRFGITLAAVARDDSVLIFHSDDLGGGAIIGDIPT
ncbi:formate dehydrogenase accessory sulfurtransferase FdhD [Roseiarcaceae bacterium H3SJ34-1]|uniref:formate dehydrogenase accessory sulfurtransferase FdhD n=1 Tax=Terripilifer ovatus TaxID=3032367 RepID=UPI003AB96051|nr:formate dehydrogenase accessory sulfurtransferase FdhD [Roseiarcaceae bacterium H3SJ34-1]